MVSQRVINIMKVVTERFMTQTCLIEKQPESRDEFGNKANAWEVSADDVPCRVIMTSSRVVNQQQQVGNSESMIEMYRLIVPVGTVLDVDYRVTVDDVVYQVVSVLDNRTDETDCQAILTRVRQEA